MVRLSCPACKIGGLSPAGFQHHIRLSPRADCRAVHDARHEFRLPDSDSDDELDQDGAPDIEPLQFEGDFFGQDYALADFGQEDRPGKGDEARNPVRADINDDDDDNNDTGAAEQAAMEGGWEQARNADEPGPADDDMDPDAVGDLAQGARAEAEARLNDGCPVVVDFPSVHAGEIIQQRLSGDEQYQRELAAEDSAWAPFTSQMDWEIARWAKLRGPGSTAFTELLKISGVCAQYCLRILLILTF